MNGPRQLYNLIVITSDELRADCLGCMGSPVVQTPAIDGFARRATVFENHFCNFPKCVPSRISLFTGRRPHTDGFRDIFNHLDPQAPDLRNWSKANGYQTALFGKSHCWAGKDFDDFVDLHSWSPAMLPFWDKRTPETLRFNDYGGAEIASDARVARSEGQSSDEIYIEQACEFLQHRRVFHQPFMMVLNLEKPHPTYAVDEPWFSMYDRAALTPFPRELPENAPLALRAQHEVRARNLGEEQLRDIQAVYYGMISKVDHLLGRLFATLDALSLWDHSIVLFVSDHGDWAGQFGLPEKWDTSFNDCLTRVPFILHAPGLPPGGRVDSLTEMVDIVPTLLGLMGTSPDWPVHGTDLQPVIRGEAAKQAVFCDGGHEQRARQRFAAIHGDSPVRRGGLLLDKQETYRRHPDAMARARMIRTRSHKLVIRETGDHELYDLAADPWELRNIWGRPGTGDITRELQVQLLLENLRTDPDQPAMRSVGA